jgi:PadR family transcriptional regulator, regulatory protein PadR
MAPTTLDLLQGTLDLLVLKTLSWGPAHGYAIARWTQQLTGDAFRLGQGSLYPALYRLEQKGLLRAAWAASDSGRKTKVYSLTAAGRKHLAEQRQSWERFSGALAAILRTA